MATIMGINQRYNDYLSTQKEEPAMEITSAENSQSSTFSSSSVDHHSENMDPHLSNHENMEPTYDITVEEVRGIMEVIAATGKFWHDWEMLKSLLSFRLMQVLSEYPESQTVSGVGSAQNSLSGETYPDLVKRLDAALASFLEGPPFTLQRLCEILLAPKATYPILSKLALALEKNLLVTSTLTICTEPYPTALPQKLGELGKGSGEPSDHSNPVPNGIETTNGVGPMVGDGDEEMIEADAEVEAKAEVEAEAEVDAEVEAEVVEAEAKAEVDHTCTDTDMREGKVGETSESNSEPSSNSDSSTEPEPHTTDEQQNLSTSQAP